MKCRRCESKKTIWQVFTGQKLYSEHGVSHDPADFARCYRILKLCPEWELQLEYIVDMFPAWKRFVMKWPKLKELYEEALKTGDGKPMYEFMKKLQEDAT
jgi:hypothetical protein